MNGWLALSPLAVFLVTYLASSLVAHDFYKVPIASAFLIASVYAMLITKGAVAERINIFSSGAGNKNVLLMIWIFVMAGAFATGKGNRERGSDCQSDAYCSSGEMVAGGTVSGILLHLDVNRHECGNGGGTGSNRLRTG